MPPPLWWKVFLDRAQLGAAIRSSRQVEWRASRSSGPGGQHVNKTNSQAHLHIRHWPSVMGCSSFLAEAEPVGVRSQVHRHYVQNQAACVDKAVDKIQAAVRRLVPPEEPSPGQEAVVEGHKRQHRLQRKHAKMRHAEKKAGRRAAGADCW